MPRIITRAEWRARQPKATPTRVSLSMRTATTVHWDGPNPVVVRSFDEACALIRRDQNFHMDGNGWNDIGYNFLVISAPGYPAIDGLVFEGRGRDVVGAHCQDHNTPWIGIQVAIGKGQKPSAAPLASVAWLHAEFEKVKGAPLERTGHKDGFNTECPGPDLYKWVHAGMPVTASAAPIAPKEDTLSAQEVADLKAYIDKAVGGVIDYVGKITVAGYTDGGKPFPGMAKVDIETQRRVTALANAMQPSVLTSALRAALPANAGQVDVDALAKKIVLELGKES